MLFGTQFWWTVASMVVAASTAGAIGGHGQDESKSTPPGREDYVEMGCHSCHGYEGQGARPTGPRLAPEPLPLEVFSNIVRRPPFVMPAYSPKVLGDEKLKRIHDYLQSIPEPPDVATIPALTER